MTRKKILCLICLLSLITSLVGCGDSDNGLAVSNVINLSSSELKPTWVYTSSPLSIEDPFYYTLLAMPTESFFVIMENSYNDTGSPIYQIKVTDHSGNVVSKATLDMINGQEVDYVTSSPDGSIWIMYQNGDASESYWVVALSLYGEVGKAINIELQTDDKVQGLYANSDYLFITMEDAKGNSKLIVYSHDGNIISNQTVPSNSKCLINESKDVFLISDDNPSDILNNWDMYYLNIDSMQLSLMYSFNEGYPISLHDDILYINTSSCVISYSISDGSIIPLWNWNSLGLLQGEIVPLSDGEYAYCNMSGEASIIQQSSQSNRQKIVFAICSYEGITPCEESIKRFNRSTPDYEIVVKNYFDYPDPQLTITTEIIAGNGPDIIDLSDFSYGILQKNTLEDLTPYFEQDNDLASKNILPGILEGMKIEGKLLSFIPLFTVETILCRASNYPVHGFQNFVDFSETVETPQNAFGGTMSRDEFLLWAFCNGNEANYSKEEVSSILQFAKDLPQVADWSEMENNIVNNNQFGICQGIGSLGPFRYYRLLWNGDISICGFPFGQNNTGIITPLIELGMCADSNVKEGVWSFFKTVYKDLCFNEGYVSNYIPVTKDAFQSMLDYDLVWVQEHGTFWTVVNGQEITTQITDARDHDYLKVLVSNPGGVLRPNSVIHELVTSRAKAYFEGDRDLETVVDNIMSSLAIYNSEKA